MDCCLHRAELHSNYIEGIQLYLVVFLRWAIHRSEPLHRSGNDRPGDRHTVGNRRPDATSGYDRRATPSFTGSG